MERSLKASDSVFTSSLLTLAVLKPVLVGFVIGFLMVGAARLQSAEPTAVSADSGAVQPLAGEPAPGKHAAETVNA